MKSNEIEQAIAHATPGMDQTKWVLLKVGKVLLAGYLAYRKVCLLRNQENTVPFLAGGILDAVVGEKPSVQHVARIVFLTLCIVRCSEDLQQLTLLLKRSKKLITGEQYVVIRGDRFDITGAKKGISPSTSDRLRFKKEILLARGSALWQTLKEIFKTLGMLTIHLADAGTAYERNAVPEVFIHSRSLWRKLSEDNSFLSEQLNKNKDLNDWLLKKMGSKLTTKIMLGLFRIPAKIEKKLPDSRDVKKAAEEFIQDKKRNFDLNCQRAAAFCYRLGGRDKELIFDEDYYICRIGGRNDPYIEKNRFIKSPVRLVCN